MKVILKMHPRVMRIGVTLILLLLLAAAVPIIAMAEEATPIKLGDAIKVSLKQGEEAYYKFTPEKSGMYVFESTGYGIDTDAHAEVWDEEQGSYVEIGSDTSYGPFNLAFEAEGGKDVFLRVYLWGAGGKDSAKFTVSLTQEKTKSIRFEPVGPIELIENVDGYEDGANFRYLYNFRSGDKLILTTDTDEEEYVYDADENRFEGIEKDIYYSSVNISDNQQAEPWGIGEHIFNIEYRNLKCEVPAKVIKNPYSKIVFRPKQALEVYIGMGTIKTDDEGKEFEYWDESVVPIYRDGDELIVTKNGEEITYVLDFDDIMFYNKKDSTDCFFPGELRYHLELQRNNHWVKGGDNKCLMEYKNMTCEVPVTVKDDSITGIAFTPASPYELIYEVDGYRSGDVFYYYEPEFQNGDKLTVKTTEGDKDYFCKSMQGVKVFQASDGDYMYATALKMDGGDTSKWTKGSNNLTIEYRGKECSVDVNIIDDPVTGILFDPVRPYVFSETEAVDGKYKLPTFANGDKLTVKRGESSNEYIYDSSYQGFVNKNDINDVVFESDVRMYADQGEKPWTLKGTNEITVEGFRHTCKVQVEIWTEEETKAYVTEAARKLLDEVNALDPEKYTQKSFVAVSETKAYLMEALEDDTSTVADIREATEELTDAVGGLVLRETADKEKAVKEANKVLKTVKYLDPSEYTEESYKAVTDAKEALEAMFADETATAKDIQDATKALEDAVAGLKSEKDAKEEAVKEANKALDTVNGLKESDYTAESWKQVTDAEAELKLLLADETTKSGQINTAAAELNRAIAELKPVGYDITNAEVVLSATSFKYNAKVQKPEIKSIDGKNLKEGIDYDVQWSNASSKKVGTYTVKVKGKGEYTGETEATYKINKAANPMKAKGKTAKVKYKKLKKKSQIIKRTKVIAVSKTQGKVTYKKSAVTYTKAKSVKMSKKTLKKYKKKVAKKIIINKKTGKVTVKKGLRKGTYKVKAKIKAAGNANYKASSWKTVTFKISVK